MPKAPKAAWAVLTADIRCLCPTCANSTMLQSVLHSVTMSDLSVISLTVDSHWCHKDCSAKNPYVTEKAPVCLQNTIV